MEEKIRRLRVELADSKRTEEVQKKQIKELCLAKVDCQEKVDSLENSIAELVATKSTFEETLKAMRQSSSEIRLPCKNLKVDEVRLHYFESNFYKN